MAPNLVTLVGLIINIAGAVIYLFFDTSLEAPMPAWMYFFSATAAFTYQTLDAVDGKQARRTGTSSPLGQLFDHGNISSYLLISMMLIELVGCDAVSLFFGIMAFCQIARTGTSWEFFLLTMSLSVRNLLSKECS